MSLTTGLQLPFGVQPVNPVPVDSWSGPFFGLDETTAINAANASIPAAIRYQSMEVRLIISGTARKYWYRDGILDEHLIEFSSGQSNASGGVLTDIVLNEVPTGILDGVNKSFSLASTPSSPASVMLWVNGQLMTQGTNRDYTVSGRSITFLPFAPSSDDILVTMYTRVTETKQIAINESVEMLTNLTGLYLRIARSPNPSSSLMLFRNGQLLTQDSDYTLTGREISILNNAIELDDVFLSTYSYVP
jgi:hypothetical protein